MSIIVSFGNKYAGFFRDHQPGQRRYVLGWASIIVVNFDFDEALGNGTLIIKDVV